MDDAPDWGDEEKGAGFLGPRGSASAHKEVKEETKEENDGDTGPMGPRASAAEPYGVKQEMSDDDMHRPPASWPSEPPLSHNNNNNNNNNNNINCDMHIASTWHRSSRD